MTIHYTPRMKAMILHTLAKADDGQYLNLMEHHQLSHEEVACWQMQMIEFGFDGLRSNRTQVYRRTK